ncbi:MAG TPA: amidohydrolase [Candidatus Polarisedimenticolia bacterium]
MLQTLVLILLGAVAAPGPRPADDKLSTEIDQRAAAANDQVILWRRDIHQNPEMGNREVRTSGIVAEHLRKLGLEVRTGVARTGVVGVLKGALPGPVVALRADMDALPVTEQVDLPFASKVRSTYNGQEVGVMHACGHDAHTAILMGTAQVLAGLRDRLPGTVKFIFQPAEEGAPTDEPGGAEVMVREGAMENPRPEAIFGLHVMSPDEAGTIRTRPGGILASSDRFRIVVKGRQTHAARPWGGIDPIVAAAQIVTALQMIESRQIDVTLAPGLVTVGTIHGGVRNNIIPDEVEMTGTLRALDESMRLDIHQRVKRTAEMTAAAAGATATVEIFPGYPITYNDPELTRKMAPTLRAVAGETKASLESAVNLGSEDFSYFQKVAPGLYVILGIRAPSTPAEGFPSNHSPRFHIEEEARVLNLGVRTMSRLAVDYMRLKK